MNKIILLIVSIVILAGGAFILLRTNDEAATESENSMQQTSTKPEAALDEATIAKQNRANVLPVLGNTDAKVKIIEFIDYKCPNCNRFHREVGAELKEKYLDTDTAYIEVRQLPFIGPDSERAALGAYCAAEQGIFESYNDAVFNYLWDNYYASGNLQPEFEDVLTTEKLSSLVANVSPDTTDFIACINGERYSINVAADMDLASANGVRGTPSFVIGGRTLSNQQPLSVFDSLINLELR